MGCEQSHSQSQHATQRSDPVQGVVGLEAAGDDERYDNAGEVGDTGCRERDTSGADGLVKRMLAAPGPLEDLIGIEVAEPFFGVLLGHGSS